MIVRNEAGQLGRALASVSGVATQLVVVDTGSTDATPRIARECGAEVHTFRWIDDFSAARNASLEHARCDWILVMDADEELSSDSRVLLETTIRTSTAEGVQLLQRNLQGDDELVSFEDTPVTRLFRNRSGHRYQGRIHEQVLSSIQHGGGRVDEASIVLLHYGYQQASVQGGNNRHQRNLSLLERAVSETPNDAYLRFQLGMTLKAAGRNTEAEKALVEADKTGRSLPRYVREQMLMRLAQLGLARGDAKAAADYASKCLAIANGNAVAQQVLALAYLDRGDLPGALEGFEKLLASPQLMPARATDFQALVTALRKALGR